MKKYILSTISVLIVAGCGGGGGGGGTTNTSKKLYPSSKKSFNVTSENQILNVSKTTDSEITLNVDTPKDIYVVVTSHANDQKVSISSPRANTDIAQNSRIATKMLSSKTDKTPQKVLDFRKNVSTLLGKNSKTKSSNLSKIAKPVSKVVEGDTFSFCTDMDSSYNCTEYTDATAKKVIANISTKNGDKTLVVWLGNNNTDDISQAMVDKLADQFLQNSDSNGYDDDIYDWDTNIYGQEWGDDASSIDSGLIGNNDTINILIYNMNKENLAGYFWAKDNFKTSKVPASNEKIMFYINSELYAVDEKETFTTLAHEFQHMIHFYQRGIKLSLDDSIWFDEMMSEATEDLVATKLKYKGPRNVDYRDGSAGGAYNSKGRYPGFNEYNYISLTNWNNNIINYYNVSSFGAFVLRNYGGAKTLHDMMYSKDSSELAVLDATGEKDFETLLNKWAEGVILSDVDDLDSSKPTYNTGDFTETTYNGITYKLGSINFFNYDPKPTMSSSKTLNKDANLYYKVGDGKISGEVKIDVNIEKGGDVIIIAK